MAMPQIITDPTRATCLSFKDPEWEFLRQSMVESHQGDQPLTMEEATQWMKEAWTCENKRKVVAWNAQLGLDQTVQDELDRISQEEENI